VSISTLLVDAGNAGTTMDLMKPLQRTTFLWLAADDAGLCPRSDLTN
jgi:hypothetical protein